MFFLSLLLFNIALGLLFFTYLIVVVSDNEKTFFISRTFLVAELMIIISWFAFFFINFLLISSINEVGVFSLLCLSLALALLSFLITSRKGLSFKSKLFILFLSLSLQLTSYILPLIFEEKTNYLTFNSNHLPIIFFVSLIVLFLLFILKRPLMFSFAFSLFLSSFIILFSGNFIHSLLFIFSSLLLFMAFGLIYDYHFLIDPSIGLKIKHRKDARKFLKYLDAKNVNFEITGSVKKKFDFALKPNYEDFDILIIEEPSEKRLEILRELISAYYNKKRIAGFSIEDFNPKNTPYDETWVNWQFYMKSDSGLLIHLSFKAPRTGFSSSNNNLIINKIFINKIKATS